MKPTKARETTGTGVRHRFSLISASLTLAACLMLKMGCQCAAADAFGVAAEFRFDGDTRNWAAPHQPLEAEDIQFTVDRFDTPNRAALFPESGFVGSMERDHVRNRHRWSWTGWIRPSQIDLDHRIIYSENGPGNCFDIQLHRDRIRVATWNDGSPGSPIWSVGTATVPVTANEWQHVAVTFESADGSLGSCFIYLNGEVVFQGDLPIVKVSSPPPDSSAFAIGSNIGHWTVGQPIQRFHGGIDDVFIFERALTSAEIVATMEPNKRLVSRVAVEIEFFAEQGKSYQLQWSDDLRTWHDEGMVIVGESQPVSRFASTRWDSKRFWRFHEVE